MVLLTILRREFFQLAHSAHGLGPLFLAMVGAGAMFIHFLRGAEGTFETLPALWGLAVAIALPFLAAVAASRGFTQDRDNGMMRLMFSSPVRARWWVFGKVYAAWLLCLLYVGGMGVVCWVLLRWQMPEGTQIPFSWVGFVIGGIGLAIQAILWCSIGTLVSLFSRSSASTFLMSLMACFLAPPLVYKAMGILVPYATVQWPWLPLQSMVYDCAGGLIDVRAWVTCLVVSQVLIYVAGMVFDALRLCATER